MSPAVNGGPIHKWKECSTRKFNRSINWSIEQSINGSNKPQSINQSIDQSNNWDSINKSNNKEVNRKKNIMTKSELYFTLLQARTQTKAQRVSAALGNPVGEIFLLPLPMEKEFSLVKETPQSRFLSIVFWLLLNHKNCWKNRSLCSLNFTGVQISTQ